MTTKRIPAEEAARIYAALDAAMLYTQAGGIAPNGPLWDRLMQAKAAAYAHLLHGVVIEVEVERRAA